MKKRRKTTKEAYHDDSNHVKKHEKKSALERSKSITYQLKSYDFNLKFLLVIIKPKSDFNRLCQLF